MILSHEHKFIFLRTKKTAGTSIELALTELCGPQDVITPLTEIDEARRANGRGPQNWRLHGWWGSPRPLLKRRWFKFTAADYGFYNHMPAAEARARIGDKVWQSYFKFAFDRNPWDRQVSWYFYKTKSKRWRPNFERFMGNKRRAYVDNYQLYTIDGPAPRVGVTLADYAPGVGLAGMSGIELALEAVRQRPELAVVFATGRTQLGAQQADNELARAVLLRKPFSDASLAAAIHASRRE
jgi:CheY-like chemotaxis protein